ncbi:MAG: hypothetical protein QNK11_08710 [Legionella sp.]|nr:hypothetical protein [Legionella sp.]
MKNLDALLKPAWGAEKWILEGWEALNQDEQAVVTQRIDTLFSAGLPFKLKHDRMLYIHAFSLMAQLEVLAIQIPLKLEPKLPTLELRQRMRTQLMDEVFHCMVFTRIVYELITPYAMPPAYNKELEALGDFIRGETCLKTAIVFLNIVGEALIEECFRAFYMADIAPDVFSIILEDEHRHVCEAELYREIGLPSIKALKPKLEILEDKLLSGVFFKSLYINTMVALIGVDGLEKYFSMTDKKHRKQLKQLNLSPGKTWQFFMGSRQFLLLQIKQYTQHNHEVELSAMRQLLMTQWKAPTDPTMVAEFDINITRLKFFEKKYQPEMLTMLMLQAVSQAVSESPMYRTYLSYHRLYQSEKTYVALVVKLPDCGDHLGSIIFEACHQQSIFSLINQVKQTLKLMVFCYKKRQALEQKYPEFALLMDEVMGDIATGVYPYPVAGNPIVSLSNNGFAGYARAKSPLRMNEALKLTLLAVQKKPVWNETSEAFEPEDMLPVSVSADHRIFNGDIPVPKYLTKAFHQVFDKMLNVSEKESKKIKAINEADIIVLIDVLIKEQPQVAYKLLVSLQTVWPDFVDFSTWIKTVAGGIKYSRKVNLQHHIKET